MPWKKRDSSREINDNNINTARRQALLTFDFFRGIEFSTDKFSELVSLSRLKLLTVE